MLKIPSKQRVVHAVEVKSLVLLSGETESLDFLRQASQLPELFVVDDNDEYPPIVEAMELLYVTASSPGRKFVHYSAAHEAPWLWYEPIDIGKVPAKGGHGTDMFKAHPGIARHHRGLVCDYADQNAGSRAGGYCGSCVGHQSNSDARRSRPSHAATD